MVDVVVVVVVVVIVMAIVVVMGEVCIGESYHRHAFALFMFKSSH